MEWKKYNVEDSYLHITGIIAGFLFFASFYFQSWLVFFFAIVLLILINLNSFYLKQLGNHLHFNNMKQRNKFFPDEKGEWVFQFENKGLPIMKGIVRIYFDDIVSPVAGFDEKHLTKYEINVPISLNFNQMNVVKIPFTAKKRGVAKIRTIEWHIPHFFGLGETILEFKNLVMQEALVYPLPISVRNMDSFLSERPGESLVSHSLYEDYLSPTGTREYVYSDSFNRINWKASARMQSLQTKVYDRVAETGLNISINIAEGHSITSKLEQLLSSAAELAYFSTKNNIPFSLCINMRIAGAIPFYYISVGTGKGQLQKALEALAMVDQHSFTLPYEKMLSFYERHLTVQPYFLHGGKKTVRTTELLTRLRDKGIFLLELQLDDKEAVLMPMPLRAKAVVDE